MLNVNLSSSSWEWSQRVRRRDQKAAKECDRGRDCRLGRAGGARSRRWNGRRFPQGRASRGRIWLTPSWPWHVGLESLHHLPWNGPNVTQRLAWAEPGDSFNVSHQISIGRHDRLVFARGYVQLDDSQPAPVSRRVHSCLSDPCGGTVWISSHDVSGRHSYCHYAIPGIWPWVATFSFWLWF